MKKDLFLWQLGGFTFSVVLGTILHFLFDWTGLLILTPISAVNESTIEHMKILFFPMLFFAFFQCKYFSNEYKGFWWIKLFGTIFAVILIPILFYTYNGAFGKTPDWLNILFFFISAGLGYLIEWWLLKINFEIKFQSIALCILIIIAVLFILSTYAPPKLPIFQDPISRLYGIIK